MRPVTTTRRTRPEARTDTKIATVTEVRAMTTVTAGANVAVQAVALEVAIADPALVRGHEIARGPGRALQNVVDAGHEAAIRGQDRGQGQEVRVAIVVAETIGALTIIIPMMDTGYMLPIWIAMLANATSRSFLANTDLSRKSGWPDQSPVSLSSSFVTARTRKKPNVKLTAQKFVDGVLE